MKEEAILEDALSNVENQIRNNNFEGLKSNVKNLVKKALKATEDIQKNWERNRDRKSLRKKIDLLHYELDYLKRFCEGMF